MRPTTADLAAHQLAQQSLKNNSKSNLSPLYSSAPPSSSTSSFSPSSTASSKSPATPATPWTEDSSKRDAIGANKREPGSETGLGLSGMSSPSTNPTKLLSRGGVSKARPETDEEEELDDEFEEELNDFGYGSRGKKKSDKKESLIDMLNSEPPAWMMEPEPVRVSLPPKTSSIPSKIRKKFSSSTIDNDVHAGFTTLQRGGSKNRKEDTSPLRSSRSAGNLLNGFRSRPNPFGFKMPGGGGMGTSNRSREDLQGSVDLGRSSSHSKNGSRMLDDEEFERLINVPASAATTKRLTAKDATSSSPATRELADFLRSDGPQGFDKSKSSLSLSTTAGSSILTGSTNIKSMSSNEDPRSSGGAESPSIMRAAMVKLGSSMGAAGRRASLGTSTSFQNLVGQRPSTSSGIPRLSSPTRTRFQRPSTAQTVASEESLYDPQNKETIQVDDSLMRGMFGVKSLSTSEGDDAKERLRDSKIGVTSPPLGVYEFVAIDERESGGMSPEPHKLGSLVKSKSLGNVSPSKLPAPRRKPVPLTSNDSPTSSTRSIKTSLSGSRTKILQDRDDTSPLAVGESPVKGAIPPSSRPFSSLVPTSEVKTPTTPYELYSTPPLTPKTATKSTHTDVVQPTTPTRLRSAKASDVPTLEESSTALTTPPPTDPIPRISPSRSSSDHSARRESFRLRSMLLQPSESASKRLSILPSVEPESALISSSSPSNPDRPNTKQIDDPILTSLDSLRTSMAQTANLPLVARSTSLDELVPTLKGLQQSMEHGSKLLASILERLEENRVVKGKEDGEQAAEMEKEEKRLVEALLGGAE
ncbi:uncharacterized protein JCM6883_005142 [Sporobolomyces salmoneus]|uniref:uncharacterized protein n=1 Tax=Sporobolomyces salmoneus TaxID=183962 RepID=UPI00316F51DF